MKNNFVAAIDVGTQKIQVIAAKKNKDGVIQIVGVGSAPSLGIRKGSVFNIDDASESIKTAVLDLEKTSGYKITEAYVSISGVHISTHHSRGIVAVSKANGEISGEDILRVIANSGLAQLPLNREILHTVPLAFRVDDEFGIKDPLGMSGSRLEVETIIISGSAPFIKNLIKAVESAGVEVIELVYAALADSKSVLSNRQKELGSAVLNLGGGITSLAVFEEGDIIYAGVIPLGSMHITNDIAIGLKTSIDVAEKVKNNYGLAVSANVTKKEMIQISELEGGLGSIYRKDVSSIIEARLSEIFELVGKELKKINKNSLLPAGIVLVGGGAKMPGVVDLVKRELHLPAEIGFPADLEGIADQVFGPSFSTVVGLVVWGLEAEEKETQKRIYSFGHVGGFWGKFKKILKIFIP